MGDPLDRIAWMCGDIEMNDIKSVMKATGMQELQAYRHLQDRRKAQAL